MHTRINTSLVVVLVSMVFGGCFIWGSVKNGYEDFTAYFNTYYNCENDFDVAMNDVKTNLMEYRIASLAGDQAPFAASSFARQNFEGAIVEASKILQLYPTSEYVENCLFIIGISYFYEDDNVPAGRKFIEEQSKFPNSKRFAEAKMYYGSIEIRNREYENGLKDLTGALDLAEKQSDLPTAALAASNISDYYITQGDSITAAVYLDSAATFSKDDDAAIYYCNAGRLYEDVENYDAAMREYGKAWDEAKDIRLKFYSRYFLARDERRSKMFDAALESLRKLRRDDKYFQFFPMIDYQRAEVLYDSGSVSSAVTEFQRIDTAYATSEAATRSAYRLANVYLYKVGDFQTALKFFQKCATHPAVVPISSTASEMASMLQEFLVASYKATIADSSYHKALLAFDKKDSTVAHSQANIDTVSSAGKKDSTAAHSRAYTDTVSSAGKKDSTAAHSQADIDTLYEHAADAERTLAGFFMFKLQMPDSAVKRYEALIKQFPKSKLYSSVLYTLGEYFYSSGDTATGRKYLDRLTRGFPKSNFAFSASLLLGTTPPHIVDTSQVEYDAAIDSVNSGNDSSAIRILKTLMKEDGKSPVVPRALYALGWVYETKMEQRDSAFVYYKKLAEQYPSSELTLSVTLAVNGFEQAERDSAAARKRDADSIASIAKLTAIDTSKAKGPGVTAAQAPPPRMGHPVVLPSPKDVVPVDSNSVTDSLGVVKRPQIDSLANHEKPMAEPKKLEK